MNSNASLNGKGTYTGVLAGSSKNTSFQGCCVQMDGNAAVSGKTNTAVITGDADNSSFENCTVLLKENALVEGNGVGTGTVVGSGGKNSFINNCSVRLSDNASVKGENYWTGGVAGWIQSMTIENTTVEFSHNASVTGSVQQTGAFVGGAGSAVISNSTAQLSDESFVSGAAFTGGFAGALERAAAKNCTVYFFDNASVTGTSHVGGFAGSLRSGDTDNCTAQGGKIAGKTGVGGSARTFIKENWSVSDCCSTSDIVLKTPESGAQYIGGFIGHLNGTKNWIVSNCSAAGNITIGSPVIKTESVGGFLGQMPAVEGECNGTINNCYASGNITVEVSENEAEIKNIGGFGGEITGAVKNCYASGHIHTEAEDVSNIGGFSGLLEGTMDHCYAVGNIDTQGKNIGGLVGNYSQDADINNSYALNEFVNGKEQVGRVIGYSQTGMERNNNCAWDGMKNENGVFDGCDGNGISGDKVWNEMFWDEETSVHWVMNTYEEYRLPVLKRQEGTPFQANASHLKPQPTEPNAENGGAGFGTAEISEDRKDSFETDLPDSGAGEEQIAEKIKASANVIILFGFVAVSAWLFLFLKRRRNDEE